MSRPALSDVIQDGEELYVSLFSELPEPGAALTSTGPHDDVFEGDDFDDRWSQHSPGGATPPTFAVTDGEARITAGSTAGFTAHPNRVIGAYLHQEVVGDFDARAIINVVDPADLNAEPPTGSTYAVLHVAETAGGTTNWLDCGVGNEPSLNRLFARGAANATGASITPSGGAPTPTSTHQHVRITRVGAIFRCYVRAASVGEPLWSNSSWTQINTVDRTASPMAATLRVGIGLRSNAANSPTVRISEFLLMQQSWEELGARTLVTRWRDLDGVITNRKKIVIPVLEGVAVGVGVWPSPTSATLLAAADLNQPIELAMPQSVLIHAEQLSLDGVDNMALGSPIELGNLGFELADGLPATVVASLAPPYNLGDGFTLQVKLANDVVEEAVFTAEDYPTSPFTIAEVAAEVHAQMADVRAYNLNGRLALESLVRGDDALLQVVGGASPFGFPTTVAHGTAQDGTASNWTLLETNTAEAQAEFDLHFVQRVEDFENQWDNDDTLLELADSDIGLFTGGLNALIFENFAQGWGSFQPELGPTFAGTFTTLDGTTTYEDWESDGPTGLAFPGSFDVSPFIHEDEGFERSWGNTTYLYEIDDDEAGTFLVGSSTFQYESITNTTTRDYVIAIGSAAAGVWNAAINGVPHRYIASGGDDETDVAAGLASAINAGPLPVSAESDDEYVFVSHDNPGTQYQVSLSGPSSGHIVSRYDLASALLGNSVRVWIGLDHLPQ